MTKVSAYYISNVVQKLQYRPSNEVAQLVKTLPTFYETSKFITIFTRSCHWSVSCDRLIQSTPSYTASSRCFNIMLKSMLRPSKWFLAPRFPTKTL